MLALYADEFDSLFEEVDGPETALWGEMAEEPRLDDLSIDRRARFCPSGTAGGGPFGGVNRFGKTAGRDHLLGRPISCEPTVDTD